MKHEQIVPNKKYPFKLFEFHSNDTERLILPHWHTSAELLLCLEGELEIRYPESIDQIKKDEIFFINSHIIHSTKTPRPSTVFVIQLPLDFMKQSTEDTYTNSIYFAKHLTSSSRLLSLIKEIRQLYQEDKVSSRAFVLSRMYEIFGVLLTDYTIPTVEVKEIQSLKNLNQLEQINQYIQANYQQKLTLEEIAARFNYNASYFSRYYKKFMGIPFVHYLKSVRLKQAFQLLRDSDLPILTIANDCGFGNVKSFYLAFKEEYGCSPQEYRRRYLK